MAQTCPIVTFTGVVYDDQVFPHIWTTTKQFTVRFFVSSSDVPTTLEVKLFGILRSKANEEKYTKNIEALPEDESLTEIEENVLLQPKLSCGDCSSVAENGNNSFVCSIPHDQDDDPFNQFSIDFELSRNHWERLKKEKFMMFVLKIVADGKYSENIRIYAQKTTPQTLSQGTQDAELMLSPISSNDTRKINQIDKQDNTPSSCSSSPESISSPSTSSFYYNLEKFSFRPEKRKFYEDFVVDMSPLPQELLRMWSNADGLKMFMAPVMNAQPFCLQGQYMQTNSFDVEFVSEKRIRVE